MRKFFEPKGNHGYGVAVSASEGSAVIGIRQEHGQGEVLGFNSPEDLRQFVALLKQAERAAFGAFYLVDAPPTKAQLIGDGVPVIGPGYKVRATSEAEALHIVEAYRRGDAWTLAETVHTLP